MAASISSFVPDDGLTHEPLFYYMIQQLPTNTEHTDEAGHLYVFFHRNPLLLFLSGVAVGSLFVCCLVGAIPILVPRVQHPRYEPPETVVVVAGRCESESDDEGPRDEAAGAGRYRTDILHV